ncbi:MAG: protein-methionine-sulfoxide reductase heme-binding subunit MsrQ [Burkholderiaceae bacterium]
MTASRLRWLWWLIWIAAAAPFVRLFVLGYLNALGANPVEFITRSTGTWTLVMLCVTLVVRPLQRLTRQAWWLRFRRMLGLWTFFYASVHLMTWVWFDQWFSLEAMWHDVVKRPFITVGVLSWLLLLPLALTSNHASMRALGRRWQSLHRVIYLIAPLAVLHFWWHKAGKNDLFEPAIYGAIVALLLGWRVFGAWRRPRAPSGPPASQPQTSQPRPSQVRRTMASTPGTRQRVDPRSAPAVGEPLTR